MSTKRDKIKNKKKNFKINFIWLAVLVLVIAGITALGVRRLKPKDINKQVGNQLVKYRQPKAKNGVITLKAADFKDQKARYYSYLFPEGEVNFFVLQSSDGEIRAAFDACDVCFRSKKGYRQEDDLMVCNNCGQKFPSVRINIEKGGCNPAPLNRKVVDGFVEITVQDVRKGLGYFSF